MRGGNRSSCFDELPATNDELLLKRFILGLVETEGLILKTYALSEADKIVYLFTRQSGVIKAVARHARRLKSRYSGHLEPFTLAAVTFFEKEERELVSIRDVELQNSKFYLSPNLSAVTTLSYFSELLLEFLPPHEANEKIYRMARASFGAIGEKTEENELITLYFEIWLLRLAGFLADWQLCGQCQRKIAHDELSVFENNSRFYCLDCSHLKRNILQLSERRILSLSQKLAPLEFAEKLQSENLKSEVLPNLTRRLIRQVLERDPKMWSFPIFEADVVT